MSGLIFPGESQMSLEPSATYTIP
ncbi:MAG: hypothetical protein QOJ83_1170, partial [Frankiales bacterium]|nr:hypothetical protein [Frankiales bacterium]